MCYIEQSLSASSCRKRTSNASIRQPQSSSFCASTARSYTYIAPQSALGALRTLSAFLPSPQKTMSWQSYVDDHLLCPLNSGNSLSSAAIVGLEGSVWACSDKFPPIKPEEITAIVNAFTDSSTLAQQGLFIGGIKYLVLQGEQGVVIRGKKGAGGVTIKKTGLALVIGIYDEPVTPPECNTIVEKLGDYLIDQGC